MQLQLLIVIPLCLLVTRSSDVLAKSTSHYERKESSRDETREPSARHVAFGKNKGYKIDSEQDMSSSSLDEEDEDDVDSLPFCIPLDDDDDDYDDGEEYDENEDEELAKEKALMEKARREYYKLRASLKRKIDQRSSKKSKRRSQKEEEEVESTRHKKKPPSDYRKDEVDAKEEVHKQQTRGNEDDEYQKTRKSKRSYVSYEQPKSYRAKMYKHRTISYDPAARHEAYEKNRSYESEDSKDVTDIKQQQEEDDDAKKSEEPAKSYATYEQPKSYRAKTYKYRTISYDPAARHEAYEKNRSYESEDSKDVTHIEQQEEDNDAKKSEEPAKSYANYEQPKNNRGKTYTTRHIDPAEYKQEQKYEFDDKPPSYKAVLISQDEQKDNEKPNYVDYERLKPYRAKTYKTRHIRYDPAEYKLEQKYGRVNEEPESYRSATDDQDQREHLASKYDEEKYEKSHSDANYEQPKREYQTSGYDEEEYNNKQQEADLIACEQAKNYFCNNVANSNVLCKILQSPCSTQASKVNVEQYQDGKSPQTITQVTVILPPPIILKESTKV